MEKTDIKKYISFDWDLFDSSTSKSEDSKTSYGFELSDVDVSDDYDPTVIYGKIEEEKQKQSSYSSTTTRAMTKISDNDAVSKKRRKRGKGKKMIDLALKDIQESKECESTQLEDFKTEVEDGSNKGKKKKKYKNKYTKKWKEKYEKYYKNKKKFILDLIREEEGPFLFKLQLQYHHRVSKKKSKEPKETLAEADKDGNTIPAEKLKSKLLAFFKASQFKPEEGEKQKKMKKEHVILNYDKIKITNPKNNQLKAFVTVYSREDGVQLYDYFFKLKSKKFSSAIYLITSNETLKKHTIREMKNHEEKKKKQKEIKQAEEIAKIEKEKRLDPIDEIDAKPDQLSEAPTDEYCDEADNEED
ncbi:unnamed protein product [Moneuplotes crassus]|uniref:Uncharacterized protein n=2 Tax=Euplotes crassus TaxID=5936 RepID=A0AAD1UM79_EUPCR|nr:unnamed protein product [Moneuplotes crassus]